MAKNIEILLTRNVFKLGNMGDIVSVRPGYARNFLIPSGAAILANQAAKRQVEILRERAAKINAAEQSEAESLKRQLDGVSVQIAANVSHDKELFGSVGVRDIVEALERSGFTVDTKQVNLHENFKQLGVYAVEIQLHDEVRAQVSVEIVNSNPEGPGLDETLAEATADAANEA